MIGKFIMIKAFNKIEYGEKYIGKTTIIKIFIEIPGL